jgi:Super-infection exclusion protein B
MDITQLTDWIKLPQRILWALVVVSALMLWGPSWFISGLGLEEFIAEYRKYLGVAFLPFLVATLPTLIQLAVSAMKKRWQQVIWLKNGKKRLNELTPQEKELLRYYIYGNTRTKVLDMADGVTSGLETEGIIYRAASVSHGLTRFSYNIRPWAWQYLKENEYLLEPSSSSN